MRDEFDARLWVDNHGDFTDRIHAALNALTQAFCKLTRIQFSAPWRTERKPCR